MIIKWYVNNNDFMRESDNGLLLRVDYDKYIWLDKRFIEPFSLLPQTKITIPDETSLFLMKGNIHKLTQANVFDKLENGGKITPILAKKMYLKFNNIEF